MLGFTLTFLLVIHTAIMGLGLIFEQTKHVAWKLNYVLVSGAIGLFVGTAAIVDHNSQFDPSIRDDLQVKYQIVLNQVEAARTINVGLQSKIHEYKERPGQEYRGVIKIHLFFSDGQELVKPIQDGTTTFVLIN